MKTQIKLLAISFALIAALYILLPVLIYLNAGQIAFTQWINFAFINLISQPILLGFSIHSYFTQKLIYPYWVTLLFIVDTILFLLPILVICLLAFSDPIPFNYN